MRRDPDRQRKLKVLVQDTGNTETTYFDETARNGRRYTYRIYALRGDEVSKVSNYKVRRYRRPEIPTATPTATATPSPTPTPTPTATPTPGRGVRSVPPPRKEKPGGDPPNVARQQAPEPGEVLVESAFGGPLGGTLGGLSAGDIRAQGFTTGPFASRLTGVTIHASPRVFATNLTLSISKATTSGQPGSTLYTLVTPTSIESSSTELDVFFTAPENATLEADTQYFVHIALNTGSLNIGHAGLSTESASSLAGWSVADNSWAYDGSTWTEASPARIYAITVKGFETPDSAGEDTSAALTLDYSRSSGESPFVREFISDENDVDWFRTNLSFDVGARHRIDIEPVNLTDDNDLQVSAFYADYPHDHSQDTFLTLEKLTDPPEGLISYHVRVTRNYGPYIKVWADNDTIGEYRIRIVYDPVMTWEDSSEILRGDLPHDDTTWANVTLGITQTGVYHYYDDHDWFAVELVAEEDYAIVTVPYDFWLTTPDIGTVVRLYDSEGNQLAVAYAGSRLSNATAGYTVPTGEGGTYYVDVSYSNFLDDPDTLTALGRTEGFENGASPFIGSRYEFVVSHIE